MTATTATAAATTTTATTTTGPADDSGTRLFGPRGRHRKPRPRKVLLAAGGLALAVGALSLVRLTPGTGAGGFGATEPDPQAAPGTETDADTAAERSTNAATTVGSVPRVSPSSTTAMGGISATPAPGSSLAPTGSATAVPLPIAAAPTTIPEAPNTPAPASTATTTPHAPATTAAPQPHPAPTPPPTRTTPAPAPAPATTPTPTPRPGHSTQPAPGLCVPIIGLCVRQGG